MSEIRKLETQVLSSDGKHQLKGVVYLPEGEKKGLFHVVHGMTEYIGRYDGFMRKAAERGYVCFGYDHLGHGNTALEGELGFIALKDGWEYLVKDVAGLWLSAMDAGLSRRDRLRFIREYERRPLPEIFRENRKFWRDVDRAARKLYRKEHGKEAPPLQAPSAAGK